MMTQTHSIRSNIITIHDAITDSPVYRAAALHFDKQLELFTLWIFDLAKQTKSYAHKLKQLNAETATLANKLNPTHIVNYHLIDSQIVDIAANNFASSLKTNLTFKMKMVSDLEDSFTQPIEQFVNTHITDFKNFRKRHELALKEYEAILARHASLTTSDSNTTQQLNAARKKYTEMSSEHVIRIVKLRHGLEHCLVEQYSATTTARKDFYNDAQVWKQLNTMLFSWTEWLAEDKRTHQVEMQKQQLAQQTLEKEYLDGLLSNRTITTTRSSQSGYLMTQAAKDPSSPWTRQWFFVHGGYLGSCGTSNSEEGARITVEACIPLTLCQVKSTQLSDRQFCFEVLSKQQPHQVLFTLQAENHQDLESWITAIAPNKAKSSSESPANIKTSTKNHPSSIILGSYDSNSDVSQPRSPAILIAKSKSTTVVTTPTDIPVTLSSNASGYSDLSIMSSSPVGTIRSPSSESTTLPPMKMTRTSPDHHGVVRLATTPSLTPLLLCEITTGSSCVETATLHDQDKLWGIPRSIIPHGTSYSNSVDKHHSQAIIGKTVWPWPSKSFQSSTPDVPGYTPHLNSKNQDLRYLFHGVSPHEVVLDVFITSFLQKQPLPDQQDAKGLKTSSSLSYHYSGSAYVTQETLWFYSGISSNCITTVALKLKDVEDIQVSEDTRISVGMAHSNAPLLFSVILEDAETVVEKLRFLVYNAKLATPMQLRNTYRKILAMSSSSSPAPSRSSSISTTHDGSSQFDEPLSTTSRTSPSRLASSNTTTTMDTTATLVDPPAKRPKKKKVVVVSKPFVDPDTLPGHIAKPPGPIACDCDDHLDRRDAEMELPISAKRLFDLMFSDASTAPPTEGGVWKGKTEGVDGHDLRVSNWEPLDDDDDGLMKRTLKYWMPVANPVVRMKEAEVVETQILLKKDDYLCYVVQISTKTEALPFADAFVPSVRYCITYIDDSRCKLTCYLGVRWLKWVMAKIIVTKAAMAGMSESVHIFVPILKEAAHAVQSAVEDLRQSEQDASKTIEYEEVDDDEDGGDDDLVSTTRAEEDTTCTAKSIPSIEDCHNLTYTTIGKQQELMETPRDKPQQPVITGILQPSPLKQQTLPPVAASAKIDVSPTTAAKAGSNSKHRPKPKKINGLVKEKLTDATGREAPSLVKAAVDSIWPPSVWTIVAAVVMCLLYANWYALLPYGKTLLHCGGDHAPGMTSQVVSHAVYLRDLDEGFIKKSLQPPYYDSESYHSFLETKRGDRTYTWYDGRHYRFALEYEVNREKLGMLRYNMINMFQALSIADADLLETEYLNWLLDGRQRCRNDNDTAHDLCDQISNHIGTYF